MGKKWFNPRDFADLIERFNPFGFKEKDGRIMSFENYGKVYAYTLERIALTFPRGYIDIPLFIHNETGMPIGDCEDMTRNMKCIGLDREEYLVEIWEPTRERTMFFRQLMQGLHLISETPFSESYFQDALRLFDMKLETLKARAYNEENNQESAGDMGTSAPAKERV